MTNLQQQIGKTIQTISIGSTLLLWFSLSVQASTPTCVAASSDSDGDGWGWENDQSCVVAFVPNSSGWPSCLTAESDSDGDGYGWENNQTCVATLLTPLSSQMPVCTNANSDPDGDGWGWENNRSCVVDNAASADGPDIVAALPGSEHPVCEQSDSDSDNDGWGWENGQSCVVDANKSNSDEIPTTTANGFPICLTTASDHDGTGYGYEFNRSCLVVDGISKTADDPLYNTEFCDSWAEITYGNYRVQNNTWNNSAVFSDNWNQCIELQQNSAGKPVPTWKFNWLDRTDGEQSQVKSYPQVYYGRKNERNISGTPEQLGLPRAIDDLDNYRIDYAYTTTGVAEYNVALESFFHTSCEADESNKQFEMMVWVGVPSEKTPGTQVTEAIIDGATWKVYANPALSWGYVAFVAEETTPSGRLDWNKFIDWSREYGQGLGLGSMENTCMGAIELGTETFWGELEFRLDTFNVVRY